MSLDFFKNGTGFYFIGIGGVSMSALAEYLRYRGARVSGSDQRENERTDRLRKLGAKVTVPQAAEQIGDESVVVYSSAIGKDNPEYECAVRRGKLLLSRAELLNLVGKDFEHTVYLAGSHGKTTATAMTAHIFAAAGKAFTLHLGGDDLTFGNFYAGGTDYFISEACEYRKNILKLYGETAVVLNCELDHAECYSSREDLKNTYATFLSRAKYAIAQKGSFAESTMSFSLSEGDYTAKRLSAREEKYSFTLCERGEEVCRVSLNVYGAYNVENALAACAVARLYGIDGEAIRRGLLSFGGVRRRFEEVGTYRGARAICDYAHHPTQIAATVKIAESLTKGTLFILFQPHTYSRTRILFFDFLKVFRGKRVAFLPTYAARENYDGTGDGRRLAEALRAPYVDFDGGVREFLSAVRAEDTVLFLGAGDIYEKAKNFLPESR